MLDISRSVATSRTQSTRLDLTQLPELVWRQLFGDFGSLFTIACFSMTCKDADAIKSHILGKLGELNALALMQLQIGATLQHIREPTFPLADMTRFKNLFFHKDENLRVQRDLFYVWTHYVNPRILIERDSLLRHPKIPLVQRRLFSLYADEYNNLAIDVFRVGHTLNPLKNKLLLFSSPCAIEFACSDVFESEMKQYRMTREIMLLDDRRRALVARLRYENALAGTQPLRVNMWDATNEQPIIGVMQERPQYNPQENRMCVNIFFPPEPECRTVEFDWNVSMNCFKARSSRRKSHRKHPYARPEPEILLDIRPVSHADPEVRAA